MKFFLSAEKRNHEKNAVEKIAIYAQAHTLTKRM